MNLTIELPDEIAAVLKAQAQAEGVRPPAMRVESLKTRWALLSNRKVLGSRLRPVGECSSKYGPAPSAEEIDANRSDMLRNFPKDRE